MVIGVVRRLKLESQIKYESGCLEEGERQNYLCRIKSANRRLENEDWQNWMM
jgi:hypothetical protein